MDDIVAAWNSLGEEERLLAEHLWSSGAPIGAAKGHRFLLERGFAVSQATVSRSLLRLDQAGITQAVGRAGRRLTEEGRTLLDRRATHHRRNALVDSLFEGADERQLVDLLHLRRSIELEAVDLVIERAVPEDFDGLDASVRAYAEHRDGGDFTRDAIEFHLSICRATRSLPYVLIAEALLPEMGRLEPLLVRASEIQHEVGRSNDEHAAIAAALRDRDRDQARHLLGEHFDAMIGWVRLADTQELRDDSGNPLPQI